jgi:AbrB family looped-hinge helix DNA binding protein
MAMASGADLVGAAPETWHPDGMKTAIDRAGRLVVPKALRDELGLQPGRKLDIRAHDGALVIEPLPTQVKLVRRGRRMVAVPAVRLPALTQDEVRAALERIA